VTSYSVNRTESVDALWKAVSVINDKTEDTIQYRGTQKGNDTQSNAYHNG
jgi:hypothetical protein